MAWNGSYQAPTWVWTLLNWPFNRYVANVQVLWRQHSQTANMTPDLSPHKQGSFWGIPGYHRYCARFGLDSAWIPRLPPRRFVLLQPRRGGGFFRPPHLHLKGHRYVAAESDPGQKIMFLPGWWKTKGTPKKQTNIKRGTNSGEGKWDPVPQKNKPQQEMNQCSSTLLCQTFS